MTPAKKKPTAKNPAKSKPTKAKRRKVAKNPTRTRVGDATLTEMTKAFKPVFDDIIRAHREVQENERDAAVFLKPHPLRPDARAIAFFPKTSITAERAREALQTLGAPGYFKDQFLDGLARRRDIDTRWKEDQKYRLDVPTRGSLWHVRDSTSMLAALVETALTMFPDVSDNSIAKMIDAGAGTGGSSVNRIRMFIAKWRVMSEGDQGELLVRAGFLLTEGGGFIPVGYDP